jgi:hypothetical protein
MIALFLPDGGLVLVCMCARACGCLVGREEGDSDAFDG